METQRYPISVGLIGVMQKEKSKMYMTSVLWSDQSDIVVYRTVKDFKKMHKQLKKAFPSDSKMKKSDRIIPKFQDKVKKGGQTKSSTKSLVRLKVLQKYCNDLLNCDPRVSQSAELIQFFQPTAEDMQPDVAKNSIMIMAPDNEVAAARQGGGNVTQPFVTETYRCVAPYETKDTKNKPFKVAVDEKVDVLIKDKAGWWLVENEDKRMAWFPAPYLEKLEDDDDDEDDGDEDDVDGTLEAGVMYIAVKNYKATKDDEINVSIGAVVEVMQKSDNGWWLIRYNGKAGYIPTMYLQPYNNPHMLVAPHHQGRRASSPNYLVSPSLPSNQLSLSQGNLLQLPADRASTPRPTVPYRKPRSNSVDILSGKALAQAAASTAVDHGSVPTSPTTSMASQPPTIMVEIYGEESRRTMSSRGDSEESRMSDSSEFSSDELNSSWASSSSFNMSYTEEQMRLSHTPPPVLHHSLSPTSGPNVKIMPSVSDPNLYKSSATPKVPPRPQTREILTRCTTITRKNATKGISHVPQTEIQSR